MHLLPTQRKLTTTRRTHHLGEINAGKQFRESIGVLHCRWMHGVVWSVAQVADGLEVGGTAHGPSAAKVDVACFANEVCIEVFDGDDGVYIS